MNEREKVSCIKYNKIRKKISIKEQKKYSSKGSDLKDSTTDSLSS
jgi:hypothetical protein